MRAKSFCGFLSSVALAWVLSHAAGAAEPATFDRGGKVIDFGVQPVSFPDVMFTEVMKRDRTLAAQLEKSGWQMRQHPYAKGNDMIPHLGDGDLEAAVFGDMPTINAAARHNLYIGALLKHTFSSVVINRQVQMKDLKGKRIGNGTGSTAHYSLLEGMASAGLTEKDVQLVDMSVSDMPDALESGKIDAFSAWEPAPTIALARSKNAFVAYRGVNNSYLVLNRKFVDQNPDVAKSFVAAFARALYWMKKSPDHLQRAAEWSLAAGSEYSGTPAKLTVKQAIDITRREAVDVPGMPTLPKGEATPKGRMANQLDFLKRLDKVPADVAWSKVGSSFAPSLMDETLRVPARYQVYNFDYGP